MKMVDIHRTIAQVNYILIEHADCKNTCDVFGTLDEFDHRKAVAAIIGYWVLGVSNG
jgi:hypothetical protein